MPNMRIHTKRMSDNNINTQENTMVKNRFFLPTSVWNLNKTKKLCELVNDTYNRDVDPNKSLSELNPDVIKQCLWLYSKENDKVLDPFLNRGTTPIMSAYFGRIGYGNDIVPMYVDQVNKQVKYLIDTKEEWAKNIHINCGDARNIVDITRNKFNIDKFDYIITSPPFWIIEPYESVNGQMSDIQNYNEFLKEYGLVIEKLYEILRSGCYCTYIINDFVKEKEFYDFTGDTKAIFKRVGFKQHDIVINVIRSPFIIRAGLAFNNEHRTIKYHEYILTFRKE